MIWKRVSGTEGSYHFQSETTNKDFFALPSWQMSRLGIQLP